MPAAGGGPGPSPGSPFPWKRVLPFVVVLVILAAGAGVALASFTDLGKETRSAAGSTWTNTNTSSNTNTDTTSTKPKTTKTSTTKTQTTRTQTDGTAQTYINTMDRLIAENDRMERQIVAMADEINRVAPGGITDQMLTDIDRLGIDFLGLNTEADGLNTPSAFGTSTRDFKALTSYNMDRCNALYSGASAWRSGQPYTGYFAEGQTAKDSYYSLYPFFIQEYETARAAAQR